MILATCSTIAAILASAAGGESIKLTGSCGPISVTRSYSTRVVVSASGATVGGLRISGANLTWRGGTVRASGGGDGRGVEGYGVLLRYARNITIENVRFTDAKKGMVVDLADKIVIANNVFDQVYEDGIIASASRSINVIGNRFQNTVQRSSSCEFANGSISGLSNADCVKRGGIWSDGYHPDAIQMRNGMDSVLVSGNVVTGRTQGIVQMDSPSDSPLRNIFIKQNTVAVLMGNAITLYDNCINCSIQSNVVNRGAGSQFKAAIRPGKSIACGNRVQDVQVGTSPCP